MKVYLSLMIVIMITSCSKKCEENIMVKQKFNHYLFILDSNIINNVGHDTHYLNNVGNNIEILEQLTKINSQACFCDVFTYTLEEYKTDRKKWEKWYKRNYCNVTIGKLDSIENYLY